MADSLNGIINQLERQKTAIDRALAALQGIEGIPASAPATSAPATEAPARKRRKFSAATRRKMALARWTEINGKVEPLSPAPAKRKISPAGMKRIIAATKRRWRLQKAAEKKAAA